MEENTKPLYRAGYQNSVRSYYNTLDEAAMHSYQHGGPIARLTGKVYRTITWDEQERAIFTAWVNAGNSRSNYRPWYVTH